MIFAGWLRIIAVVIERSIFHANANMIIERCPNCGAQHISTEQVVRTPVDLTRDHDYWNLLRCNNPKCRQLLVLRLTATNQGNLESILYPISAEKLDDTAKLPDGVRDDFEEASRCLAANCIRASMVMSRRALQRILKDQGCTDHKLVNAIKSAIDQKILRQALHPLAEEIREYGNLGAHPDDDELTLVEKSAAEQILKFVKLIVHEFYEIPDLADGLKRKRTSS